jgi:hypothetical protein
MSEAALLPSRTTYPPITNQHVTNLSCAIRLAVARPRCAPLKNLCLSVSICG